MIADGVAVMVNSGGPDIPGTVWSAGYPNAAIAAEKPILVRFETGNRQWIPGDMVRPMLLADHKRVRGLRRCDFEYQLWYTLIFSYAQDFTHIARAELGRLWNAGWGVGTVALQLADTHGWTVISRRAHETAPADARRFIADLGLSANAEDRYGTGA